MSRYQSIEQVATAEAIQVLCSMLQVSDSDYQ